MMAANGILVVDKPQGRTSRMLTTAVGRLLQEKRAGHLGTLDPNATGVLPILLGQATRLARYLEGQAKEYRAVVRLGRETDTWDAAGKVVKESSISGLTAEQVREAALTFQGGLEQVPPMHSALKQGGQPLYRLARKGVEVPRAPRKVRIEELEIEAVALPDLTLRVVCSPGTYLRSLAHDLGEKLGVGAHLLSLRRLRSGRFSLDQAVAGQSLELETAKRSLIRLQDCLPDFPLVSLSREEEQEVGQGRPLARDPEGLAAGRYYRLVREELVAVARAEEKEGRVWLWPQCVLGKSREA
jgi:tRNA pseudouridine55 synthase